MQLLYLALTATWRIATEENLFYEKYKQCMYVEARLPNHGCRGKTIILTYSECMFVALGIQHTMRMLHTVICNLSGSTIFFHIISQQRHEFWGERQKEREKKKLLLIKYVFSFSIQVLSETFLILIRSERDIIKTIYWSSRTVPVILVWL
jgi:hypothetical protein